MQYGKDERLQRSKSSPISSANTAFKIEITKPAIDDIEEAIGYIRQVSQERAAKWVVGLEKLILSLADMSRRYPVTPKLQELKRSYRAIVYYAHTDIYRIDKEAQEVYIVRIYHGAGVLLRRGN